MLLNIGHHKYKEALKESKKCFKKLKPKQNQPVYPVNC